MQGARPLNNYSLVRDGNYIRCMQRDSIEAGECRCRAPLPFYTMALLPVNVFFFKGFYYIETRCMQRDSIEAGEDAGLYIIAHIRKDLQFYRHCLIIRNECYRVVHPTILEKGAHPPPL